VNKPFRLLSIAVVAVVVLGLCAFWLGHSRSKSALAKYKSELRARGEKLTWAELGYPRPPQTNRGLTQLVAAANRLGNAKFEPGMLALMNYVEPGRAQACWTGPNPRFSPNTPTGMVAVTWAEMGAAFQEAMPELADIRAVLENPPRYLFSNPSNFLSPPILSFVQLRKAAQWLSGDSIRALHEHRLGEAQANLHSLIQMVHLHEDDPMLVGQMIRVAIAGLALADTWEALQAKGWAEEALASLQKDWESVELAKGFETGMLGERAFGEATFAYLHTASPRSRRSLIRTSGGAGPVRLSSPEDYFEAYVVMPWWAANADADEMFFLQYNQRLLDSVRKLHRGVPWPVVISEISQRNRELEKVLSSPLESYRHLGSGVMIPNVYKASSVCVRNETQRRLTVTALALARYRLRTGKYPESLEALVPDFLAAVPLDLMSAKPLCYRLNSDGSYVLYSVGEDGQDDGGDASSVRATKSFDLWSGRDAVWPVAAGPSP
jgi:hypothetical protein